MGNCLDVCLVIVHYSSKNWIVFTAHQCYGNYRYVLLHAIQILMNQFGFEFSLMIVLVMEHPLFFIE